MAGIPGLDVEELPANRATMRQFMADPGPGNPRVGPGGSPQAQAFQTANAANIGPPEPAGLRTPPSGTPVRDALARAARDPSLGLRSAGEAVGQGAVKYGGQSAQMLRTAGQAVGKTLLGSSNSILSGAAATMGHGNAYFDKDMPMTDKLRMGATDALATAGGAGGAIFGGGVGSVVPVAGTLAGAVAGGYGGERLGRKAGNFLFGGDEAQKRNGYDPERNLVDVARDGLKGKGEDSFGVRSFGAGAGRGFDTSQIINPAQPMQPNVPDAPASPGSSAAAAIAQANAVRAGQGSAEAPAAQPTAQPQGLRGPAYTPETATHAEVMQAAKAADAYNGFATPGVSGIRDTAREKWNNEFDRRSAMSDLDFAARTSARSPERIAARQAYASLAGQGGADGSAERIAGLRERGETQRAIAANQTQAGIHRENNAATRYGAELGLQGHRMSNDVARAQAMRDQGNKDRQYTLDVAKYGTEVADKNRAASEGAAKAEQTGLENRFRTTDDKGNNVADHAKIASYNIAVDATLPSLITELLAAGTPEARSKAQELQTRGRAALGPEDHDQLQQLFATREQLRGARSKLPGGAEFIDSNDLTQYRQKAGAQGIQKNAITPDRVQFRGGSSATKNDLQLSGGANAFWPDFGKVRNDNLTRGVRLPE
jgi:hypothetical protein